MVKTYFILKLTFNNINYKSFIAFLVKIKLTIKIKLVINNIGQIIYSIQIHVTMRNCYSTKAFKKTEKQLLNDKKNTKAQSKLFIFKR